MKWICISDDGFGSFIQTGNFYIWTPGCFCHFYMFVMNKLFYSECVRMRECFHFYYCYRGNMTMNFSLSQLDNFFRAIHHLNSNHKSSVLTGSQILSFCLCFLNLLYLPSYLIPSFLHSFFHPLVQTVGPSVASPGTSWACRRGWHVTRDTSSQIPLITL